MIATSRQSRLTTVELAVAGVLMVFAGLSVLALAFMAPAGAAVTLTASAVGIGLLGIVLVASGVETLRRRHFAFALLVPVVLAIIDLGYAIATHQTAVLGSVVILALVAIMIGSRRAAFRD